ncbi:MAG TPA: glycine oxidase ThiO [Actinomycetota bacterium]|nr:glycine oxidase ThiO [Actinomycetota bacterium]
MIVGGGIIGLSIAWRSAGRGLSVIVFDDPRSRGASEVAAGMLAPVTEVHYGEEALLGLNIDSARRFPAFVGELEAHTGVEVRYRRCGTLMVARDADDNAVLGEIFSFQQKLGLEVERLRGRDARELEPGLSGSIRGAILAPNDHQVDPPELVAALRIACVNAGVELRDQAVTEIVTEPGRAVGVRGSDGTEVRADTTVVAGGAASGALAGLPAADMPPVRPVKGQVVHLAARGIFGVADRNIRGLDTYIVSRTNGRVVIGATVEEVGADSTITAGGVHDLLRSAYELVPGITELRFVRAMAGLRPATPDNAPLLGRSRLLGLVVATGHYRNGILLAPATADLISELLVTGSVPEQLAPFSPQRFATGVVA